MKNNNRTGKVTIATLVLGGLVIFLLFWVVILMSSKRVVDHTIKTASSPGQNITQEPTDPNIPLSAQFLALMRKKILIPKLWFLENPILMPTEEADPNTLRQYTLRIMPKSGFTLLPTIRLKGNSLYTDALAGIDESKIRGAGHLRRRAVKRLLKHAESLMIESFFQHNNINVLSSDFDVSLQDLEADFKALVVKYGNSPGYSRRFRRIMRPHEYENRMEEIKERFIKDCILSINLKLAADLLRCEGTKEAEVVTLEPTKENLISYIKGKCKLTMGVPQLNMEELLGILIKQKEEGFTISFNPVNSNGEQVVTLTKGNQNEKILQVSNKDYAAIQKRYTRSPLGGLAFLHFDIKPDGSLSRFESYLTFKDEEKFCSVATDFISPEIQSKIRSTCYYDGSTAWIIEERKNIIAKMDVSQEHISFDKPNIGDFIAKSLKDAVRSYYIEGLMKDYAVFEFEFKNDKAGTFVIASYFVRMSDKQIVKLKEVTFQNNSFVNTAVFLSPLLIPRPKATEYIKLVDSYYKNKPAIDVTFEVNRYLDDLNLQNHGQGS